MDCSWWSNCWSQLIAPQSSCPNHSNSGHHCLPLEPAAGWPVPQVQIGSWETSVGSSTAKQLLYVFGTTYNHQFQISFKMVTSPILREVGEKDRIKVDQDAYEANRNGWDCRVHESSQPDSVSLKTGPRELALNRTLSRPPQRCNDTSWDMLVIKKYAIISTRIEPI